MEMLLNIVRMIDYDQAFEFTESEIESIGEKLAISFINSKDFKEMYLVPSLNLHLSNKYGDIIVKFKQNENLPKGIILMPVSIWSNQLTYTINGDIIYKNIKIQVEGTRDQITKFDDIIKNLKI